MIGLVVAYAVGREGGRKRAVREADGTKPTTFGELVGALVALGVVVAAVIVLAPVLVLVLSVLGVLAYRREQITRDRLLNQSAALSVVLGAWLGAAVSLLLGADVGLGALFGTAVPIGWIVSRIVWKYHVAA
jgi:hypothetical protein